MAEYTAQDSCIFIHDHENLFIYVPTNSKPFSHRDWTFLKAINCDSNARDKGEVILVESNTIGDTFKCSAGFVFTDQNHNHQLPSTSYLLQSIIFILNGVGTLV